MRRAEIETFFTHYRDAFNRLDGDAVADLWHVPSGITDGRAVTWWSEDAPMRNNHRALCAVYAAADYARADFEILHAHAMGADDAFVHVDWTLQRHDGTLLQRFGTGYNLRRTPAGPKVLLATAYAEDLSAMNKGAGDAAQ
jgi:hypothetical protein